MSRTAIGLGSAADGVVVLHVNEPRIGEIRAYYAQEWKGAQPEIVSPEGSAEGYADHALAADAMDDLATKLEAAAVRVRASASKMRQGF